MKAIFRGFIAVCLGTCLTQLILLGYFATRGSLDGDTATKVIALLNGIDITGNRLQQVFQKSQQQEQPDYEEILEARKMETRDMDLRLRSQKEFRDQLSSMLAELKLEQQRFDERREAFDRRLAQLREDAREQGLQEVQRTLQALEPDQAKEQLLRMFDDDRIDEVVNIVQAMAIDKRKQILAEFTTADEAEKLHEVLRRIGEGQPTTSLIDQAGDGP